MPLGGSRVRLPAPLSYLAPRLAVASGIDAAAIDAPAATEVRPSAATLLSPGVAADVELEQRIYRQVCSNASAHTQPPAPQQLLPRSATRAASSRTAVARVRQIDGRGRSPPPDMDLPFSLAPRPAANGAMNTLPAGPLATGGLASQMLRKEPPADGSSRDGGAEAAHGFSRDSTLELPVATLAVDPPAGGRAGHAAPSGGLSGVAIIDLVVPPSFVHDAKLPPLRKLSVVDSPLVARLESPVEMAAPRLLDSPLALEGVSAESGWAIWDDAEDPTGSRQAGREREGPPGARRERTASAAASSQDAPRRALIASVARHGLPVRVLSSGFPYAPGFAEDSDYDDAPFAAASVASGIQVGVPLDKQRLPRKSPLVGADQTIVDHQREAMSRLSRAARATDQRKWSGSPAASLVVPGESRASKPPAPPLASSASEPLLRHAIAAMSGGGGWSTLESFGTDPSLSTALGVAPSRAGVLGAPPAEASSDGLAARPEKKRKKKAPKHAQRLLDAIVGRF